MCLARRDLGELFLVWFGASLALGLLGFMCLARRDLGEPFLV